MLILSFGVRLPGDAGLGNGKAVLPQKPQVLDASFLPLALATGSSLLWRPGPLIWQADVQKPLG